MNENSTSDLKWREATRDDCRLFFAWANEATVGARSLNTASITFPDHVRWFQGKLDSEATMMLVFLLGETPIGQVRLDLQEGSGGSWRVSFSVDKAYRGKRLGTRMMARAMEVLAKTDRAVTLVAEVRSGNVASSRIFLNLGFSELAPAGDIRRFEKPLSPVRSQQLQSSQSND